MKKDKSQTELSLILQVGDYQIEHFFTSDLPFFIKRNKRKISITYLAYRFSLLSHFSKSSLIAFFHLFLYFFCTIYYLKKFDEQKTFHRIKIQILIV